MDSPNQIASEIAWKYKRHLRRYERAWWLDVMAVVAGSALLGILVGIVLARLAG